MTTGAEVIDTLFNESRIVLGESKTKVEVRRVKLRNLSEVIGIANTVLPYLKTNDDKLVIDFKDVSGLINLIQHLPVECEKLMGLLSDLPKDQIGDLDLADSLQLLGAIVKANVGFFTEKVLPQFNQLVDAAKTQSTKAS